MAAEGYPAAYRKGDETRGLEEAAHIKDMVVFHAGTVEKEEKTLTNGGRVLGVTALGSTVKEAIDLAYRGVAVINWKGVHYRRDIGQKALKR
jgi:phosphoribosylamine--glycine ligase